MASMAAAIAASRSVVMSGNRPLDERERKRFSYFASLSPMARKIMQDKEKVRERYGPEWARLPPAQQDAILDRCLLGPGAPAEPPEEPARFPGLRGPTGQKLVRFGDEDITWQDEHSAPFSWETRSQMEFSVSSLSIQEPGVGGLTPAASEPRPPASKAGQGPGPALRPAPGSKPSGPDGPGPARKDEEAAFWKINAERSRGEGAEAAFASLTPSQIKSMEKGEKVLPPAAPRDREARAERPGHLRAEPLGGVQPQGPPPGQAGSGMASEEGGSSSEPGVKPLPLSPEAGPVDGESVADELFSGPSAAQVSTSSVILKSGFDFLDNW